MARSRGGGPSTPEGYLILGISGTNIDGPSDGDMLTLLPLVLIGVMFGDGPVPLHAAGPE